LAGGQARLIAPNGKAGSDLMEAALDFRDLTGRWRLGLRADRPEGWKDAMPPAAIIWQGPLFAPVRQLEIAALVNALGARAIEREARRVELLEIDIRERSIFNRRAKVAEFMHLRAMELAVWQADRERERLEKDRLENERLEKLRLEQEAALKAEQARKPALPQLDPAFGILDPDKASKASPEARSEAEKPRSKPEPRRLAPRQAVAIDSGRQPPWFAGARRPAAARAARRSRRSGGIRAILNCAPFELRGLPIVRWQT
jgi:hypothetical protein